MKSFEDFSLLKSLQRAITDLGFKQPTPIQQAAYSKILSGQDVVGIAQTGTGKTLGYMLPILQQLPFSKQIHPRVLILVPTRELVAQVVEEVQKFTKYATLRCLGVYGGSPMNAQKTALAEGTDIVVATPGRLYDLVLAKAIQLKTIKKVVIDEVDVMLDLGFRFQLINIFDLLPSRRQNIMFSATMTDEVDLLIDDFFKGAAKITVAVSGTPLDTIAQVAYAVPNFYTKVSLLQYLLKDATIYHKVLVFVATKRRADLLFAAITDTYGNESCLIHSNKTQNYRERSIKQFEAGVNRILITTDVMSRGLDLDQISHVISFDTPNFPENYIHRIGRTGRAEQEGRALLLYTEKEASYKTAIETLMKFQIPVAIIPKEVAISAELTAEERPKIKEANNPIKRSDDNIPGPSFHEKKAKNQRTNQGGSYKKKLGQKYKKAKTRGDKNFNRRNKKK